MIREPVYLLSDDADQEPHMALMVSQGNNGDYYISVLPKGHRIGPTVRVSTSGGASTRVPGATNAIHQLWEAINASQLSQERSTE
jgi:hypothetical protein